MFGATGDLHKFYCPLSLTILVWVSCFVLGPPTGHTNLGFVSFVLFLALCLCPLFFFFFALFSV